MITWQFLIDLQDGNGQRDITALVRDETVNRVQRLYNKLAPVSSSISFEVNYNSTLFPLLISQKKDILLEVNRESAAFFTGVVRPTFQINSKNIGPSGAGDTVTFEGLDYSYYLDRVHGWNGQNDLVIASKKVCDPADQSNSAVHLILAQAGITGLGSLPTISDTVSLTIPTSVANVSWNWSDPGLSREGKTFRTNIKGFTPTGESATYLPYLKDLLFDFGYTFYFTEAGNFQTYLWDVDPAAVSTTDTATQSNIQSYSLQREDYVPDRYDVVYTETRTNEAGGIVDETRQKSDASSVTFTGVLNRTRVEPYIEILRFSVVLEFQYGPDGGPLGPLYRRVVSTDDTFPVVLMPNSSGGVFYTGKSVTGFTVDDKGNYSIAVSWTGAGNASTVTKNEIYAVYTYAESIGVKSKHNGTTYRPQSYTAKYIDNGTDALAFAASLAQYGTASQTKVRLNSSAEYSLGEYIALTEALNGLSAVKLRVIERSDGPPVTSDGSFVTWRYTCDPIETIATTTDTELANAPTLSTRGLDGPDPRITQAASIIAVKPQDGSTYTAFPASFIQWDPQTETLEIAGDLYLSGDSTVQGKITVGGSLSSTIYTSGSAGWSIDAAGNAEFYAIKLRGTIDAAGAVLGGYTITSTALYAGTGATRIQLDTTAGIWLGATTIGAAPFSVTLAGALAATSGQIGGWTLASDKLSSAGAGTARIELRQADKRVAVVNSSNADQVVMGYLNGLPKNDGSGNWGVNDYGFWARTGDTLRIDGDAEYVDGDWLISGDASYIVENAGTPIVRMGTYSTEKGFFINETATGSSYRAKLTADNFRVGNDTAYIEFVGGTGALTIALANFYVSSTLTNILGTFQVSAAGTVTSLTDPVSITTNGGATYGRINQATSIRLAVATVDKLTATSTGVGVGTTSPSGIFDVQKNQNATTQLFFRNTDTTGTGARLEANFIAGSNYLNILAIHSDAQYLQVPASSALYIQQGAGFPLTVSTGGNLLVGTTTSGGYKFEVNGTVYISGASQFASTINTSDTTEAQNTGVASIATAGGIYTAKKIYAVGDIEAKADINQIDLADSAYLGIIRPRSQGTTGTGGIRYFYFTSGDTQNTAYDILNTYFSGDGAIPCMGHRANLGQVGVYLEKSGTTITMKSWDGNVMSTFADGSGTTLGTDHHIYLFST